MQTDPYVAIVFFASVLLIFCGVIALVEDAIRRHERRQSRAWRRRMNRHYS